VSRNLQTAFPSCLFRYNCSSQLREHNQKLQKLI